MLAALLCLGMLFAPGSALAAGGSISGRVTAFSIHLSPGANPIEGVKVCAWPLASEEGEFCSQTDAEGDYEIAGLANGEYGVEFNGRGVGYETRFYANEESWWEADPVVVEGGPVTGIDADLHHLTGIEGTVTRSADGEPVGEVEVCAWPVVESEESFGGCGETAADGSYLIAGLEPGEYKVEFWPGYTGQNLAYQFYKDKDRWFEADTVVVEAEGLTPGIDAELHPGATISGAVTTATGLPLNEIVVCSIDAPTGQLWICTLTEPDGSYELPFHSKGQYQVVFSLNFAEWFEEGSEPGDGYPTQFWNNQTTLAAADVIPLAAGQAVPGIDARLGLPPPVPPMAVPPVAQTPTHHKRRHCRTGFVRKKVKGKVRCVRRHKHRRHHRVLTRAPREQRPSFRIVR